MGIIDTAAGFLGITPVPWSPASGVTLAAMSTDQPVDGADVPVSSVSDETALFWSRVVRLVDYLDIKPDPSAQLFPEPPEPQNLEEAKAAMSRPWHDPRKIRELPGGNKVAPAEDIRRVHPLVEADPAFRAIHTTECLVDGVRQEVYDLHRQLSHAKVIEAILYFTGVDLIDHASEEPFPKNLRCELTDDEIIKVLDFFGEESVTEKGRQYRIEMGRAGWTNPVFFETDIDDVAVRGNGAAGGYHKLAYRFPQAVNHFIRQVPIPGVRNLSTETLGLYWGGVEMMAQTTPKDLHIMSWLRSGLGTWGLTDNSNRNVFSHTAHFPGLRAVLLQKLPYQKPDIHKDFEQQDNVITSFENGLSVAELLVTVKRAYQSRGLRRIRVGRPAASEPEVKEDKDSFWGMMNGLGFERRREKSDMGFFRSLDADTQERIAMLLFGKSSHKAKMRQVDKKREKRLERKPAFHVENSATHAEAMMRTGRSVIRETDRRMSLLGGNFFTYDPLGWFDGVVRKSGYSVAETMLKAGKKDWSDKTVALTQATSRRISRIGTLNNMPAARDGLNRHIVEGANLIRNREGDAPLLVEYNPKPTQVSALTGAASNVAGAWLAFKAAMEAAPDGTVSQIFKLAREASETPSWLVEVLQSEVVSNVANSALAGELAGASALALAAAMGAGGRSLASMGLTLGKLLYLPMHPDAASGVEGIMLQRVDCEALSFRESDESHEQNFRQAKQHIRELKAFFRFEVRELEEVRQFYKAMMKRKIRVVRPEGSGAQDDASPDQQAVDRWVRLRIWRDRIWGNIRN